MGAIVKMDYIKNCSAKNIKLFDITGLYDDNLNMFGYGAPNEDLSMFESFIVNAFPPGATVPIVLNLFPDFPNLTGIPFFVNEDSLGVPLVDGLWRFEGVAAGTNGNSEAFEKTFSFKVNVQCALECCISKKLQNISPLEIGCCDEKRKHEILDILLHKTYLESADESARCGNDDQNIEDMNTAVTKFCDGEDCECGCGD